MESYNEFLNSEKYKNILKKNKIRDGEAIDDSSCINIWFSEINKLLSEERRCTTD